MAAQIMHDMKFPKPEDFDGSSEKVRRWVHTLDAYFAYNDEIATSQNQQISADKAKALFALRLMTKGHTLDWSGLMMDEFITSESTPGWTYPTWPNFRKTILQAFQDVDNAEKARMELMTVQQNKGEELQTYINRFKAIMG